MINFEETARPAAGLEAAQRWLPALLLLFVGSGCAALIYEVIWLQLLQLSIGSSAVSVAILLGIFMGGMCLGSLLLPKYIDARQHPLRAYAFLELGIGLFGIIILPSQEVDLDYLQHFNQHQIVSAEALASKEGRKDRALDIVNSAGNDEDS